MYVVLRQHNELRLLRLPDYLRYCMGFCQKQLIIWLKPGLIILQHPT